MKVGFSTSEWLFKYCQRHNLTSVGERTPNVIHYPRQRLMVEIGHQLMLGISRPVPLALEFIRADSAGREKLIQQRLGLFISMANLLKDDSSFIFGCMYYACGAFDRPAYQHQLRVSLLSAIIVKKLGLNYGAQTMAGLIHDFGKIGLPLEVLNRTQPWTENEREKIAPLHLAIAMTVINNVPNLKNVADIVKYNHYYDGYPEGIRSQDIPLEGQVLSMIDYYDALTNPRPSRNGEALSVQQALDKIEARGRSTGVKTPYDPRIIAALKTIVLSPNNP